MTLRAAAKSRAEGGANMDFATPSCGEASKALGMEAREEDSGGDGASTEKRLGDAGLRGGVSASPAPVEA